MSNPTHIKRALQLLACGLFCHRAEAAQAPPATPAQAKYVQWYYMADDSNGWNECDRPFSLTMQKEVEKGKTAMKKGKTLVTIKRKGGAVYDIQLFFPGNDAAWSPWGYQVRRGGTSRTITSHQPDANGVMDESLAMYEAADDEG